MAYIDISNVDITNKSVGEEAIYNSIYNIVFTKLGELPGLPEFGSRIYDFVFELADLELEHMFRKEVEYVIERWEPRVEIEQVIINMDEDYNRITCTIRYYLKKDIRDEVTSRFISFTVTK